MNLPPHCIDYFKVLAVHTRFIIFQYLKHNSNITISHLVKLVGLTQPTVTFHINKLIKVGLVRKRKIGRRVYCRTENHRACEDCPLS